MAASKETIARELKEYIRKKGLTQKEAADKIGVSPSHLANLLNARESIGFASARRICDAFPEISTQFLLLGEGQLLQSSPLQIQNVDRSPNSTINQVSRDAEVAQLREQLAQANEEKARLLGIIESMTKK